MGALEAQQTFPASSIASSAWDDPAVDRMSWGDQVMPQPPSRPEVRAVDPHAMQDDSDLAGHRDDRASAALGLTSAARPKPPGWTRRWSA